MYDTSLAASVRIGPFTVYTSLSAAISTASVLCADFLVPPHHPISLQHHPLVEVPRAVVSHANSGASGHASFKPLAHKLPRGSSTVTTGSDTPTTNGGGGAVLEPLPASASESLEGGTGANNTRSSGVQAVPVSDWSARATALRQLHEPFMPRSSSQLEGTLAIPAAPFDLALAPAPSGLNGNHMFSSILRRVIQPFVSVGADLSAMYVNLTESSVYFKLPVASDELV